MDGKKEGGKFNVTGRFSRKGDRKNKMEKAAPKKEFPQLAETVKEEATEIHQTAKEPKEPKDNKRDIPKHREDDRSRRFSIKSEPSVKSAPSKGKLSPKSENENSIAGCTPEERQPKHVANHDHLLLGLTSPNVAKAGRRSFSVQKADTVPAEEKPVSAASKQVARGWDAPVEGEAKVPDKTLDTGSESIDYLPVIPDLEDVCEEDFNMQVAIAPNKGNIVATYKELDHDLLEHAALLTLDNDVDIKLLTRSLWAKEEVKDDDKPWDWVNTFTEITSQMFKADAGADLQ